MKKPPRSESLEPGLSQDVEIKLVNWVRGIAESHSELVHALDRLCISYKVLLSGLSVTDACEVLRQVEDALRGATKAQDLK